MLKNSVKVCTVNFEQKKVASFNEFATLIEYYVDVAKNYSCDFILFPEFVTMPLLTIENKKLPALKAMVKLGSYTKQYIKLMSSLAVKHKVNIIGGTHIVENENICFVFLRDGTVHKQAKIHATPSEVECWKIKGGDKASVIKTDKGPIGIMVCYDSEFPELARHLVDQGAKILFVPFCTDTRQGFLRVRYCCLARTVENQCYVVMSGNTGNLPYVENMDINYAQSAILTPSDHGFARDGILAETEVNVPGVVIAELNIADLVKARESGSVRNLKDRRLDLYSVNWKK
ncbi:MAG: carbon-nitrogen hydrolase family protein [Bacteriovoracaceae bacterium]